MIDPAQIAQKHALLIHLKGLRAGRRQKAGIGRLKPTRNAVEMKMRILTFVAGAVAALAIATPAAAADHVVKMLNNGKAGMMVFEPALVTIAPGDSVKFVATDKSHNAETIKGMFPDGAKPFAGKMNEDITVTFDQAGVYGVKCTPHYGMGMVSLVVVGKPGNEEAARAVVHAGKAKTVFNALFDKVTAERTAAK